MKKFTPMRIGVVTFPISKAGKTPVSSLLKILCSLSDDVYFITGNEGCTLSKGNERIHTYCIRHEGGVKVFTRILRYVYAQLIYSYTLAKITRGIDLWIFYIGGEGLLLPILTARLLRTKVVLALAGFPSKCSQVQKDPLSIPTGLLSKINFTLSNGIFVYSKRVIEERHLEKYKDKISIAHEHFLDFDKFKIKKQFAERENTIGYVGTLNEVKGVLNFVHAIPKVIEREKEIGFLIGGDGDLFNEIKEFIAKNDFRDKIKLTGWIPDEEFSTYLNELKLFVLPSYTEGLPNVVLEAMACGTPVLATPVGAIPDVIKDGETGFIMENNSPECIARNIIRALDHPDLEEITKNARALMEEKYNYQAAVDWYRIILSSTF